MGNALEDELDRRLAAHLRHWLGAWPPAGPVTVVGSALREAPGWDGSLRRLAGVETPAGAIVSVPPRYADRVAGAAAGKSLDELAPELPALVDLPGATLIRGVFRSCTTLVELPDAGIWLAPGDPRVPEWLRPFNGDVLVALDAAGGYAAGVGRKAHDGIGQELAVATEPEQRGRHLARRLVAQAARRVVAEGGVATYLHRPDNLASAAVAQAAGFPERGWRILGLPVPG